MNVQRLETMVQFLCTITTDDVFQHLKLWGFTVCHERCKTKRYAVRQGSTIDRPLLVCHADTVKGSSAYQYDDATGVVVSAELDDRLGIAVILCLLSEGIDVSCLICDNEETGNSTASVFARETDLVPVWMTEFDRRGIDVVCYEFETPVLCSLLEHCGFTIGQGSFSDISSLESLGVIGFNVGVAYHKEHSLQCHANLRQTLDQAKLWLEWYNWLSGVRLAHEQRTVYRSSTRYDAWSFQDQYTSKILDNPRVDDWDNDIFDSLELCDHCGNYCDAETMCEFSGGSVCECCIVDIKGIK